MLTLLRFVTSHTNHVVYKEINVCEKSEKISQYKGVHWHKQIGKWYAKLQLKAGEQKFGGTFNDELDAAKRVNQLCEKLGIPAQNPEVSAIPNQQYQVTNMVL